MSKLIKFFYNKLDREHYIFLIIGGINYIVNIVAFNIILLTFNAIDPLYALWIANIIATILSYIGNKKFVFDKKNQSWYHVLLFFIINILAGFVQSIPLYITHNLMGFHTKLINNFSLYIVGIPLAMVFRFVLYKYMVFK